MYIGVDLAWGQTHPTGLAAVDDDGALITLTQRRTDGEILGWLSEHAAGPAFVAFDAPVIVNNQTGNREAERLVARHFGRFQAFCHSTNRANRWFADGGRALMMSRELGLDIGLRPDSDRRGFEVYPHPAIVALFDLPRILRYKDKPGRTLELRRFEMLELIRHLEGLATAAVRLEVRAAPEWAGVRHQAETATTKAGLSRIEDSLDAVVCAYVALFWTRNPGLTAVLGTAEDGFIVTPVNPSIRDRIAADQGPYPERARPAASRLYR